MSKQLSYLVYKYMPRGFSKKQKIIGSQKIPKQLIGAPTTITCSDGSTATCSGGTQGCFNNSPLYCSSERPIVGGPITISCPDGSTKTCSSGTQGCFNNSPLYCGSQNPSWSSTIVDSNVPVRLCRLTNASFTLTLDLLESNTYYTNVENNWNPSSESHLSFSFAENNQYTNILGMITGLARVDGRLRFTLHRLIETLILLFLLEVAKL